jgi:hypothetical protein
LVIYQHLKQTLNDGKVFTKSITPSDRYPVNKEHPTNAIAHDKEVKKHKVQESDHVSPSSASEIAKPGQSGNYFAIKSLSKKSWKRMGRIIRIPYSSAFICVAYGKPKKASTSVVSNLLNLLFG